MRKDVTQHILHLFHSAAKHSYALCYSVEKHWNSSEQRSIYLMWKRTHCFCTQLMSHSNTAAEEGNMKFAGAKGLYRLSIIRWPSWYSMCHTRVIVTLWSRPLFNSKHVRWIMLSQMYYPALSHYRNITTRPVVPPVQQDVSHCVSQMS
jgi:hypothetical protein